jgi:hypothetical protein
MKIQIIIILLFAQFSIFCQVNVNKSSIDSGGASTKTGNISIIYTLGEVVVQEATINKIHVSEGFLSPELSNKVNTKGHDLIEGITIYPNPTADIVNLRFNKIDTYTISIFANTGQLVSNIGIFQSNKISLNMKNYNCGVYLLLIKSKREKKYKSFKIIKN